MKLILQLYDTPTQVVLSERGSQSQVHSKVTEILKTKQDATCQEGGHKVAWIGCRLTGV